MKKPKFILTMIFIPLLLAFSYKGNRINKNEIEKTPAGSVAYVKMIVKDVTYRKTSVQSDWDLAKTGTLLNDGGEVKTGSKSLAIVQFIDGSGLLRVRENSVLHIYGNKKEKAMDKNTIIEKGLIGFEVNKQAPDEDFKFTTPTVVASIRGTDGFLEYSDDSTFTMYLSSGSVGLYSKSNCDSVAAGNTIVIRSNGQCISRIGTAEDINKNKVANQTTIRKINIKTNKGEVNIEYYGPSN